MVSILQLSTLCRYKFKFTTFIDSIKILNNFGPPFLENISFLTFLSPLTTPKTCTPQSTPPIPLPYCFKKSDVFRS